MEHGDMETLQMNGSSKNLIGHYDRIYSGTPSATPDLFSLISWRIFELIWVLQLDPTICRSF